MECEVSPRTQIYWLYLIVTHETNACIALFFPTFAGQQPPPRHLPQLHHNWGGRQWDARILQALAGETQIQIFNYLTPRSVRSLTCDVVPIVTEGGRRRI